MTAGTLFHKTHKPLRAWFLAVWFVTSQKHGASALGLKRVLGLGSYNTAWTWLHKLRRAMVRPGRDQLTGAIEVDETYVGGRGTKVRGRGAEWKSIVAIAAEVRGRGPGRLRMCLVPNVSATSLHEFVVNNVQVGAEIRTDGWSGYKGIENRGYNHVVTNISTSGDPAHVVMPRVHRVASLLDRRWLGIHQGAIRPQHLDYYPDEFTFRFNRRTAKARGLLFYRLMEKAVDCAPSPRRTIVGYGMDTADPALYDMVLHIGTLSVDDAARTIAEAARLPSFQTTPESKRLLNEGVLAAQVEALLLEEFPKIQVTARGAEVFIYIHTGLSMTALLTEKQKIIEKVESIAISLGGAEKAHVTFD